MLKGKQRRMGYALIIAWLIAGEALALGMVHASARRRALLEVFAIASAVLVPLVVWRVFRDAAPPRKGQWAWRGKTLTAWTTVALGIVAFAVFAGGASVLALGQR